MKTRVLLFTVLCGALLMVAGCKNKEPQSTKIESINFKKSLYEIEENYLDLNMFKELVVTPEGIKDTAKINWTIDDDNVAEMVGKFLMPKGPGDVKVTATIQGKSASCKVSISEVPITDIKLKNMTLNVGETAKIEYTTEPENVPIQRFNLKSNNVSVATVDEDGNVTGVKNGSANITATYGDLSSSCTITVNKIPVKSVSLNYTTYKFDAINKTLQLVATVLPDNASYPTVTWSSSNTSIATVNNSGLVTCKGYGSAVITAKADDKSETCTVVLMETVTDACNNTYSVVKIGSQYWMTENMRCNKYASGSERPNERIYTSSSKSANPSYVDARIKRQWGSSAQLDTGDNLSAEQISSLGLLYSWAAATAIATGTDAEARKTAFSTKRQGICPNGFHLPTMSEYETLAKAVGGVKNSSGDYSNAGKKLKVVSGWWRGYNGTDDYGFSALPSGYAYKTEGLCVENVGFDAHVWTATPSSTGSNAGCVMFETSDVMCIKEKSKSTCYAVRCVKN